MTIVRGQETSVRKNPRLPHSEKIVGSIVFFPNVCTPDGGNPIPGGPRDGLDERLSD